MGESTKVPCEVVALTLYRGLQFSYLYLGQGESPPRVSVKMRERVNQRGSPRRFRLGLLDRDPHFVGKILQ